MSSGQLVGAAGVSAPMLLMLKFSSGVAVRPGQRRPAGQGWQAPVAPKAPLPHPTQKLPRAAKCEGQVRGTQSAAEAGGEAERGWVPLGQAKAALPVEMQEVEPVERVT